MDQAQSERMRRQLNRALEELSRLAITILRQETSGKEPHAESTGITRRRFTVSYDFFPSLIRGGGLF